MSGGELGVGVGSGRWSGSVAVGLASGVGWGWVGLGLGVGLGLRWVGVGLRSSRPSGLIRRERRKEPPDLKSYSTFWFQ